MNIETYEALEYETGEQAPEMQAEALQLIEELGLEGQARFVDAGNEPGEARCPYRRMTAEEERVYSILCPDVSAIGQYDASPMPLRVMQVAAHARKFFAYLYVLHPKDRPDDDPVLVGTHKKRDYGSVDDPHILARWGATLLPFAELRTEAIKRWVNQKTAAAKKRIAECETFLASVEAQAESYMDGEYVVIP